MNIEEMIKKYGIKTTEDGNLKMRKPETNEEIEFLKANKKNIIDVINNEKRKQQERKEKIQNIVGLEELKKAIAEHEEYNEKFRKSFDGEYAVGGMGIEKKPTSDVAELKKKYPQATAYLTAENKEGSSNYEISSIGKKAKEKIINGDWENAIKEMNEEINKFVEKHIWD